MESGDPRPRRVVVINDDTTFLELMRELLGELGGYQVDTVKEWDGAVQSLNERAVALSEHGVLAIAKPFDIDEMLALVENALGRSSGS